MQTMLHGTLGPECISLIKRARDLWFFIEALARLIGSQDQPDGFAPRKQKGLNTPLIRSAQAIWCLGRDAPLLKRPNQSLIQRTKN